MSVARRDRQRLRALTLAVVTAGVLLLAPLTTTSGQALSSCSVSITESGPSPEKVRAVLGEELGLEQADIATLLQQSPASVATDLAPDRAEELRMLLEVAGATAEKSCKGMARRSKRWLAATVIGSAVAVGGYSVLDDDDDPAGCRLR